MPVVIENKVPSVLLEPCIAPINKNETYGGYVTYARQLISVIDKCNDDKAAIRRIMFKSE